MASIPVNAAIGLFPNVPDLPGVPPLKRKITSAVLAATPLFVKDLFSFGVAPTWGIFDSKGNLYLQPDSFLGMEYRNGCTVSDYPVEQGAFNTYNKVQTPFEATVSLAKGGEAADRAKFLLAVENIFATTNLYTIITPELTYSDVTITRYDYERRTRNGANFIVAHIQFIQVRQNPTPGAYSQPTATSAAHQGQVSVLSKISSKVMAATALTPILSW